MRTLIISDLHLGNGGVYDAFAGEEALPALLDQYASPPTRVLVNGDGIDFLMNEEPLDLDPAKAAKEARSIVRAPATAAVLAAFGRVLAAGGEVIIRLGNHDVELSLSQVQDVIRGALGQPPAVAARLRFQPGEEPAILEVGGARILVTHGEHNDPWNKVDYEGLKGGEQPFVYAPGSTLVKRFLNPLTNQYGLRFANLLKPDFQGATLTALAVAPTAMKLLFQDASVSLLWQLFRTMNEPCTFPEADDVQLDLADRVAGAGLTAEEQAAFEGFLGDGPVAFNDEDDGVFQRARLKLARAGLKLYAGVQRRLSGAAGDRYFELEPTVDEWKEAERLASKFSVNAVIFGHTHAARWKEERGLTFANTGTWIWLMQLPRFDAGDEVWAEFLTEIRQNPGLSPERQRAAKLLRRATAALIEEKPGGGAALSLIEWTSAGPRTLGASDVAAPSA